MIVTMSNTFDRIRFSRRQAAIVRDLESLGGHIGYEHEWDDRTSRFSGAPKPGNRLLRAVLGDHFFLVPTLLLFSEFNKSVESLACMMELRALTHVGIVDSPNITDPIVDFLIELPNLVDVSLYGTMVTRTGVARLNKLNHLIGLCVSHTLVNQEDLNDLQSLFTNATVYLDNNTPRTDFRALLADDEKDA